jgi:hypothetical protein
MPQGNKERAIMNRKVKSFLGSALLGTGIVLVAGYSLSQAAKEKEFDPVTAPLCEVRNETKQKILLKVVDEPPTPPTTGGNYTIYPKGEKSAKTSIYCHSKVEIYFQASTKPIETVVIDEPGVISLKRQRHSFKVNI